MPSTLYEQLLELPEEKIIESMAQHGTRTPEWDVHKQVLDILHHRQIVNASKKESPSLWSTLWRYVKILWAPVVVLGTIIGFWNQEFWNFVKSLWHAVIG